MVGDTPPVAGIILSSGMSSRFAAGNKLLALYRGEPIVRRVARAYVEGRLDPVLVVVGHDGSEVAESIGDLAVQTVWNPDYRQGQSRALVTGVRSLPADAIAAVIGVGDQPELTHEVIAALVNAFRRSGADLVAPRFAGKRGNPVLFSRALFAELLEVEGDVGGRPVIERHRDELVWVDVPEMVMGMDVDTVQELEGLAGA